MTDDLTIELGKLLDQYDEKLRSVEERRRQVKADGAQFLKAFADLRLMVVRPVFEDFGAVLRARGHDFSITEREYALEHSDKAVEAEITMHIMPSGVAESSLAADQLPSLSLVTRHYNRTVCIRASSAVPQSTSSAGPRGDYQLAQVNAELVKGELLKLIAEIVKR